MVEELRESYTTLDVNYELRDGDAIDASCLLAFEYPEQQSEISIGTDEFSAVCPWTRLPDFGNLTIKYSPRRKLLELKSLKYYLLSYRDVGIVQEHAANHILKDLVAICEPDYLALTLDYKTRGGLRDSSDPSNLCDSISAETYRGHRPLRP